VLGERLTALRAAGLALGAAGLVLLLEPWSFVRTDDTLLLGFGLLLLAAIAAAASTVHVRAHRWRSTPLDLMPWQLLVAAVPVTVVAFLVDGVPRISWSPTSIGILAYQVVVASAFGVWGALTMMRSLPAISVNLTLMVAPVVGVVSSVLLGAEAASLALMLSLILVLAGVALGLWSDRRQQKVLVTVPG